MIAESLVSFIGGGLLRALPEVLGFFDKKNERGHELAIMDKQKELKAMDAANGLKLQEEQHEAQVDMGLISAFVESQKAAFAPSGVKWIDGFNKLIRPGVATAIFGLYIIVKISTLVVAISQAPASWGAILAASWTSEDMSLLNTVVGFFFTNRYLEKRAL